MLTETEIVAAPMLTPLQKEADELLRIIVTSSKTVRARTRKATSRIARPPAQP
jgi:hypothetical protein